MKIFTDEQILAKHARNYKKTIEEDGKTLYHLQLNGHDALAAMEEYALQYTNTETIEFVRQFGGCIEAKRDLIEKLERITKMIEDELKRNIRINMPGISPTEQEETWQRYKKLNNL